MDRSQFVLNAPPSEQTCLSAVISSNAGFCRRLCIDMCEPDDFGVVTLQPSGTPVSWAPVLLICYVVGTLIVKLAEASSVPTEAGVLSEYDTGGLADMSVQNAVVFINP